jgi:hypothetical protein
MDPKELNLATVLANLAAQGLLVAFTGIKDNRFFSLSVPVL